MHVKQLRRCEPYEPGGRGLGKHVTTSATLARTWGRKLVEWRREENPGYVPDIRIRAEGAESVDFVGPRTDVVARATLPRLSTLPMQSLRR